MNSYLSKFVKACLPAAIIMSSGLVYSQASAQDSGAENCKSLSDPSARLACYDRLFSPAPAGSAPVSSTPSTPAPAIQAPSIVPQTGIQNPAAPEIRIEQAPVAAASIPAPSRKIDTLTQTPEEFKKAKDQTKANERIKEVSSKIVKTDIFGYKKVRFYLENGQVWQQNDSATIPEPRISKNKSPFAKITKGALGSYILRVNGKNRAIKVRRVR